MNLAAAVAELARAGVAFVLPAELGDLSLAHAAAELDVARDWLVDHIAEFPNAYRLPAGSSAIGQPRGEWRIPKADIAAFRTRQQALRRAAMPLEVAA